MTGLEMIDNRSKIAIAQCMERFYPKSMADISMLQDMALATASGRKGYNDIGTDSVRQDIVSYVTDNFAWINVCLFVNEEFRACFRDAILIEKALLQVSRDDYRMFRDDMVLASEANDLGGLKCVHVDLSVYDQERESLISMMLSNGYTEFMRAGMTDAYNELRDTLPGREKEELLNILYNVLYFVNAINYNGVFRKYVKIVVDNVKKQLA